jgi:hypothetical protein
MLTVIEVDELSEPSRKSPTLTLAEGEMGFPPRSHRLFVVQRSQNALRTDAARTGSGGHAVRELGSAPISIAMDRHLVASGVEVPGEVGRAAVEAGYLVSIAILERNQSIVRERSIEEDGPR